MQLENLFKPIGDLTDEELKQRLQEIRHNRETVRPAAKAHAKRTESKGKTARFNKVESLLAGMSPEDIRQLLLEVGTND